MMMRTVTAALCTLLAMLPLAPAWAQANARAPGAQLSGTVQSLDGRTLVLKMQGREGIAIVLPQGLRMLRNEKTGLDDIRAGDFIASAAVLGADGRLHAQEVRIFPEALRGSGEGHRPMSSGATMTNATVSTVTQGPSRTMTNATVANVASAGRQPGSRVLSVSYPGGTKDIEVAAGVPIVRIHAVDLAQLKPGTTVNVAVTQSETGLVASRLSIISD
jgi:hypothetical protein